MMTKFDASCVKQGDILFHLVTKKFYFVTGAWNTLEDFHALPIPHRGDKERKSEPRMLELSRSDMVKEGLDARLFRKVTNLQCLYNDRTLETKLLEAEDNIKNT